MRNISESDGKKRPLVVVCSNSSSWRIKYAAEELASYSSRILDRKVAFSNSTRSLKGKDFVVVGWAENDRDVSKFLKRAKVSFPESELGEHGFFIRSFRSNGCRGLLIAGKTDLGTLYGVYHYLEAFCKVGFFWSAEHIPHLERLPLTNIRLIERPHFAERYSVSPGGYSFGDYWNWDDWKKELEFKLKKKQNLFSFGLGADLVWRDVLAKHGVTPKPYGDADVFRDKLARRVAKYARKLGLKLVTPAFMGDVPSEFAKANSNVRYVESKRWDLSEYPNRLVYPSDHMFKTLGEEFIRIYAERYGTDHIYFVPPYPESYTGQTPEERTAIKLDFAKAVQEYMAAADPKWIWLADSWTFFTSDYWPLEEVKAFCLAADTERFRVYDTWGEERPLYKIHNYYQGRYWSLGFLHCFGGNTSLHGDLQGLVDSVRSIVGDPEANRCLGIYLVPEAIHHNDLYWDLAMTLWWKPEGFTLTQFLRDYAERRYGKASAKRMTKALNKLAQSVYGDKDMQAALYLRKLFGGFDFPNTGLYVPPVHARYAVDVREAISLALKESINQKQNQLYWRDLIDMARRYFGDVFNQRISRLYYAFESGNREAFQSEKEKIEKCLNATETVLWSWKEYHLENLFKKTRKTPAYDPANERTTRDMLSLWVNANLLDYARRDDMAELFTNYYLKRAKAYLDHLEKRLDLNQPSIDEKLLDDAYTEIGKKWTDGPWDKPKLVIKEDPIGAVRNTFKECKASSNELLPRANDRLVNSSFNDNMMGWNVSKRRMDVEWNQHGGPGGSPVIAFKGWTNQGGKLLCVWQDIKARDDLNFEIHWKLDAYGKSSRAGLRIEVFDKKLRKKAELTYQFGDGKGWWPDRNRPDDAKPDWSVGVDARLEWWTGFYAVKKHLGNNLGVWNNLHVSLTKEFEEVHGSGTWKTLEPARLRVSLIASNKFPEDPIEGAFSKLVVY